MEPTGTTARRNVLGGLAAVPALAALSIPGGRAVAADASRAAAGDGGGPRYFPWPLIKPGSTIAWPAGAVALTADGRSLTSMADLASVPARGAASRQVYLTGFAEGAYTVTTPGRRPARVTWDAARFPFLRVLGEYGQRTGFPYWGYYGLIITPVARPARAEAVSS